MWFGVDDGVVRYNGVDWAVYTPEDGLPSAPVSALLATRDGSVYGGTDKGIDWRHLVLPPDDNHSSRFWGMLVDYLTPYNPGRLDGHRYSGEETDDIHTAGEDAGRSGSQGWHG